MDKHAISLNFNLPEEIRNLLTTNKLSSRELEEFIIKLLYETEEIAFNKAFDEKYGAKYVEELVKETQADTIAEIITTDFNKVQDINRDFVNTVLNFATTLENNLLKRHLRDSESIVEDLRKVFNEQKHKDSAQALLFMNIKLHGELEAIRGFRKLLIDVVENKEVKLD